MEHLQKKDVNCLMKCSGEKDSKFVLVLEYEKTTYVVLCFTFRATLDFSLLNALFNIIDHGQGISLGTQKKYYVSRYKEKKKYFVYFEVFRWNISSRA